MKIKDTIGELVEPKRNRRGQKLVRRWYMVQGETGVSFGGGRAAGLYTSVGIWHDKLKDARAYLKEWMESRGGLFWGRILRVEETRTLVETHRPYHPVMRQAKRRK